MRAATARTWPRTRLATSPQTPHTSTVGRPSGQLSGLPYAHLAIYKVCNRYGCPYSAILKGFLAAVSDGVDVISASINHQNFQASPYYEDVVTIAAFRAVAKGVLVVSSVGNKGPDLSSIVNDVPWHLTVGAGSVDRKIVGDMVLENGDLVEGEALVQGVNSTTYYPMHCPSAGSARQHIIICDHAVPSVGYDVGNMP